LRLFNLLTDFKVHLFRVESVKRDN
jgi:hypothetical protein